MKQTIVFKAGLCLVYIALILAVNNVLFVLYAQRTIGMTKICAAVRDIPPRTLIGEEDLYETEVPKGYILPGTVTEKSEIIGKYTPVLGMIPAGSPFFSSMLEDPDEVPDHAVLQLKEGQTVYGIAQEAGVLRGLKEGMRVDIHVLIERKDAAPVTGCLIRDARILTVRDHQGLSIRDPESSGLPHLAEAAVERTDIELLTVAESVGKLRLYPSDEPYGTRREAARCEDSAAVKYVLSLGKKAGKEKTEP